jgi:hypothetical protein
VPSLACSPEKSGQGRTTRPNCELTRARAISNENTKTTMPAPENSTSCAEAMPMRKGAMAPPYAENDVRTTVANCIRFRSISMSAQRTRADCPQTDHIFLMRALFEAPPYLQPAVQANAEPVVLENSPRGQRGEKSKLLSPPTKAAPLRSCAQADDRMSAIF